MNVINRFLNFILRKCEKIKKPNRSKNNCQPKSLTLANPKPWCNDTERIFRWWERVDYPPISLKSRFLRQLSMIIIDSKLLWSGGICAHEHLKNHSIVATAFSVIGYEIIFGGILCRMQYVYCATIYVVQLFGISVVFVIISCFVDIRLYLGVGTYYCRMAICTIKGGYNTTSASLWSFHTQKSLSFIVKCNWMETLVAFGKQHTTAV